MGISNKKLGGIICVVIFAGVIGYLWGSGACTVKYNELEASFFTLNKTHEKLVENSSELILAYNELEQKYNVIKQEFYYLESERNTLLVWLQEAFQNITELENRITELEEISHK